MPLEIVRNDITKMQVDAIVNAANSSLLGGGGVDGCIHRAAGPGLLTECRTLGGCPTGEARITGGYGLPCRYVIHTVGPVWQGGQHDEKRLLTSCYRASLALAQANGCETVAFPLISAGAYGYPRAEAVRVAVDTIGEFLTTHDMTVYLTVFDKSSFEISSKLLAGVRQYIDDVYTAPFEEKQYQRGSQMDSSVDFSLSALMPMAAMPEADSLDNALSNLDEGFTETLLRLIDRSGLTDAACYKRANIDRKLFSKIRSNPQYQPAKSTVLAFAVALRLSLEETRSLLEKAGYALSHSSRQDVIVEYCLRQHIWDINEVNAVLFQFDQGLLGSR